MLPDTAEGEAASADCGLVEQVAKHKAIFFRSGWASYDTARPGTLRLLPDEARLKGIRADHKAMALMMFDKIPPSLENMFLEIGTLQKVLNKWHNYIL